MRTITIPEDTAYWLLEFASFEEENAEENFRDAAANAPHLADEAQERMEVARLHTRRLREALS